MGAGRPPKPTAVKILEGKPGHRPLNDAEPKAERGVPECPAGLIGAAKKEWHRIVPLLDKMGVLGTVDGAALEGCCTAYALRLDALKHIKKHGQIILSATQVMKPNPAVAQYLAHTAVWKAFLTEFGMTPSSRSRLKVEPATEADPFETILNNAAVQTQSNLQPVN
jgi:P27 family predicted phage terminase small subunit